MTLVHLSRYDAGQERKRSGTFILPLPDRSTHILVINTTSATLDYSTLGSWSGQSKFGMPVLASDGLIYVPPIARTEFLVIDPTVPSVNDSVVTPAAGAAYYSGAVQMGDYIVSFPWTGEHTMVMDIDTYTQDTTSLPFPAGTYKFRGGVVADNGKAYSIPYYYDGILVIAPEDLGIK